MTQQTDLKHIESQSMDLTEHNIEQLKQLFPNVFSEGKVDFNALKSELGEFTDTDNERYQFTWNGKEQAKRIATTPSLGTLRPAPEESVNWDSTENLYIEGDNLEVLKILQKSYFGKVKMIYIDPPYNTGKDFVYKDDFKDNLANYQRLTGQKDEEGNPLTTNADSSGRYHSNWLNMMYPRLKLARNLLRDDGVIFISIDDNEVHNLRKICDEIFGEGNFIAEFIHKNNSSKNQARHVSVSTEYFLCFAKNKAALGSQEWRLAKRGAEDIANLFNKLKNKNLPLEEIEAQIKEMYQRPKYAHLSRWNKVDDKGVFKDADLSREGGPKNYTIVNPNTDVACVIPSRGWGKNYEELVRLQGLNLIWYGDDRTPPGMKDYINSEDVSVPDSFWYFDNSVDTRWIKNEFGALIFENPKPLEMLKNMLEMPTKEEDIILDFFSGSATSAHAVMQLNALDKCNRKFIMVQIPEPTPEKSEARKTGYETIPEIGKERIRRAAKKIKEEHPDTQVDLGFKVFKLDTSNIKKWQPNLDDLETDLLSAVDNILPDRTSQDLLFEVLIKYGLPLTLPVEQINIQNNGKSYQAWNVANNALIACFDENLTSETIQSIAALSTPENPVLRVVFRDTSFQDDITKTNAIQRLKQAGIEDVLSI